MPYKVTGSEVVQDDLDISGRNATFVGVATAAAFDGLNVAPTGSIAWFADDTAPTGWLALDGSNVSRTTYSRLFAIFGTSFGSGDGSSTFGLPDMRGRFFKHESSGNSLTKTGGIPPHNHSLSAGNAAHEHPGSNFSSINAPHAHPANTGGHNTPHTHPGNAGNVNAPHSHTTNTNNAGSHHHEFTGADDIEIDNTNSRDKFVNGPGPASQNANTFGGGAHSHPTINCNTVNAPHSHAANTNNNQVPHNHSSSMSNNNVPHTHPANLNTVNAPHSHGAGSFTGGASGYVRPKNIALLPIVKT
jgi:microcystin-dependent protein|tara:strand:+ start:4088 stop:4993 length:906 start_codon:yes stop_codon:yes gene_type:complete